MSEKFPENMWDLRKPTLVCWWENTEHSQNESKLSNTIKDSPSARQTVGRWLSMHKKYDDTEKKDHTVKNTRDDINSESTVVRIGDIDEEYIVGKKNSADKSNDMVRKIIIDNEVIIEKKDDIFKEDNNDREDIKRNDRNDGNINDRNRIDNHRNDNSCKCNKRQRQAKSGVSTKNNIHD